MSVLASVSSSAQAAPPPGGGVESQRALKADTSPPLRSMAPGRQPVGAMAPQVRHRHVASTSSSPLTGTPATPLGVDPVQQSQAPTTSAPAVLNSWDGISNINGAVPPDTEGDVGPNDYVQWVNLSFQIWSKTGTPRLAGPVAGNTLWSGFGGTGDICANDNQGDPVVLYDRLADRWVFTQFGFTGSGSSGPYYMCMAVSQTGDPTGSYYRFEFPINASSGDFPDYPKLGVWPDGYYMTTNNFSGNTFTGAGFYAFDRTKMLAGDSSATMITFPAPGAQYEGVLPAGLSGPTTPPAGSPDYFGSVDTASSSGTGSTFQIWKAHADFATPANSTLSPVTSVAVAPYTWSFCGQLSPIGCVPQPGTHRTLDPLADRLMFRLQYRNFGDHETLIASHTVNVGSGSDRAGVRWYEIRSPGSSPFIQQQGTFAPADSINRWMGSAAMDGNGGIALGYSASDSTSTYPSVFYTGRLASDPLGTMTQGEGALAVGAGSQTTALDRWGDYSAMSIDPSDDSTFWYTQEYYSTTSSEGWKTRIGSFRLEPSRPTVTLTSPANGNVSNNSTPPFAGTAGTAAGDSQVTVNVYAGSATGATPVQTRTASVGAGGSWSVGASPSLADGTYTARAQQSDSSGDTGYSSANTFRVDTTPPTVTLTSPAGGSFTRNTMASFSGSAGTASGDSPTVAVKVYAGTGTSGTLLRTLTTTASGGAWSVAASPALAEGTYTAQAQQSDSAGNTATSSANTFTVDTTPPAVTLTAPANGGLTNNATPTFSGTAGTATGDLSTITVTVYAGTGTGGTLVQTRTATASSGTWSVGASPALPDGTYTAQALQSDSAGSTGSSSANTFTIDTTPPAVTLNQPTSPTENATPTLTGAAGTAARDLPTITVQIYPGTAAAGSPVQTRTTTASGSSWSVAASPALSPGTYTAQAQQSDAAGNTAFSSTTTFTVRADELPVASFGVTTPAPLAGQPVAFDASASGDPDGAITSWSWDFGDGSPLQTASQATTAHTYAASGTYNVSLTVNDTSGNSGSAAQSVTIAAPLTPNTSSPSQQPPAPSPSTTPSQTPPLIAYLQVRKQRLGPALARGIRLTLGANAPGRATLQTTAGGSAARRLAKGAVSRRTAHPILIGTMQVTLSKPGTIPELVTLKHRAVRLLRNLTRVALSFHLTVTDHTGRSTSLTSHVVLQA